ncbi:unnamed protein product [Mycena citricolor]|uniref:Uncharacterized protein n=1 Tax=Mycena citricolor TaxID=2018698 RepID=A0AAD2HVR7_9AGAR|nr:unnamed protein product [Mycena citricolor]CAK5282742.1 unnamed protein product [Mycena citricolor]
MSDKFSELRSHYKHAVQAEALLFNNGRRALRLEVPDIGKEFTDGLYIGKDPEGTFYYNYADNFDRTGIKYKTYRYVNKIDNKTCAWIKFYTESENQCFAEFLGVDADESVRGCNMDAYEGTGSWKDMNLGAVTCFIRKYDDQSRITISCPAIKATATITDTNNVLRGKSVKVGGNLHFKDIDTVKRGRYASYNNDRIVFYESTAVSTDFTAFFVPYESAQSTLEVSSASTAEFSSIIGWENPV